MEGAHATSRDAQPPAARPGIAADIMARWAALLAEYEAFRDALRAHVHQPHWPGVGPYIVMLRAEAATAQRSLDKLQERPLDDAGADDGLHQVVTNLVAKEAMWRTLKTCRGVLALERRFPKPAGPGVLASSATAVSAPADPTPVPAPAPALAQKTKQAKTRPRRGGSSGTRTEGVFVNAVVDNGREWLRVLTTTTAQLLSELAEIGWEWGGGDDAVADGSDLGRLHAIAEVSVVETALGLVAAARANCAQGAFPRICILLTRIDEDEDARAMAGADDVRRFMQWFRRGMAALTAALPERDIDGSSVAVAVHTARSPRTLAPPPADLGAALQRLMPDVVHDRLSPTLNIDTSILIALASDITHASVAVQDWHPAQRVEEIQRERQQPGHLLRTLCEAMRGRRLVCTREAARAFRDMVRDMAQVSEQARAALLVRDSSQAGAPVGGQAALVEQYRALSAYAGCIPDDLLLPIAVIDEDWDRARIERVAQGGAEASAGRSDASDASASLDCAGQLGAAARCVLPPVARRMAQDMDASVPTLAVFFYGWASGNTTITTNLAARNRIARLLEQHRTSSREQGPHVWICRTARSLNGTRPRSA